PLTLREVAEPADRARRFFILNRRTFATLPQSLITHQRRLWFFVESTNSHPQVSPSHCRTCSSRPGDVSRSAADRAIGPSGWSRASSAVAQVQLNPFFLEATRRRPRCVESSAFK